ncbi:hypothetical protein BH10PSE18_BH10PSE18_19100 [soil metagenome]
MTIVALPLALPIQSQVFGLQHYDVTNANEDTGSSQTRVQAPARRLCTISSEDRITVLAEAALWTSLMHAMDGQVNQVAVYSVLKPAPLGTARGAWTAASTAVAGASTLVINAGLGQVGKTVLQGDWIGVNQASTTDRQLLHVQSSAVVDNAGLVTVEFRAVLRVPVVAGSAIVWDRPTCLMRRTDSKTTWTDRRASQGGFTLDLIERWEP